MTRVSVIGVPSQGGGRPNGTARGVGALRAAGLTGAVREVVDAVDEGDVAMLRPDARRDPATALIAPAGLSRLVRDVDASVTASLSAGRFPFVVGGDCPILLGCIRAVRRHAGSVGLIHVDGHEDHYLPSESPSGAWSDCEIAFALGSAAFSWDPELRDEQPIVDPSAIALVGVRDLPELREQGVRSLGGRVFLRDAAATRADVEGVTSAAMAVAAKPRYWLHLDWDVLATDVMPAVIAPTDGGLGWDELDRIMMRAAAGDDCAGISAGTYNPDLDPTGEVAGRIVGLLARWLSARDR